MALLLVPLQLCYTELIASCVYLFNRSGNYRKHFDLPTCLLLVTGRLTLLQPGNSLHSVAFNDQQNSALVDYLQLSVMLLQLISTEEVVTSY